MDALGDIPHFVGIQGIGDVIGRARLHRLDRFPDTLRRGHDDDLRGGERLPEPPERIVVAAQPGSPVKGEIDEDEFIAPFPEKVEAAPDRGCRVHVE